MKAIALFLAAALAAPAAAAPASEAAASGVVREARIPFVNFGGIRNYHVEDDDVVYLQDQRRNWYRAQLSGPCFNLRSAFGIGVDTRGSSDFDRFSTIVVGGERCPVESLTHSEKPQKKKRSGRNRA